MGGIFASLDISLSWEKKKNVGLIEGIRRKTKRREYIRIIRTNMIASLKMNLSLVVVSVKQYNVIVFWINARDGLLCHIATPLVSENIGLIAFALKLPPLFSHHVQLYWLLFNMVVITI